MLAEILKSLPKIALSLTVFEINNIFPQNSFILVKGYKCSHFGVTSNLCKVAYGTITHLAVDLFLQMQ